MRPPGSAGSRRHEGIKAIALDSQDRGLTGEGDRIADVQAVYSTLVKGSVDPAKFTTNLNYYFNPTTLGDYRSSLAPLGTPTVKALGAPRLRGGFVNRNFSLHYPGGKDLLLITYAEPGANGRWEQFMIMPQ